MSDGAVIAVIGFATVLAAGIPTTASAFLARQARDHAATAASTASEAKETLGQLNGDGDAMTMLARTLAETGQLLRGQEHMAEVEQRLVELANYTHSAIHRLNGQVGMMWATWAKEQGIDIDQLPPPKPSPNQENP